MSDPATGQGKPLSPLLKMAAVAGIPATVQLHLRRGENVNAKDDRGRTALFFAASRGHSEVCRLLVNAGADVMLRDKNGDDAFSIATRNGHKSVEAVLSEHLRAQSTSVGSDAPIETGTNHTPLPLNVREPSISPVPGLSDTTDNADHSAWEEDVEVSLLPSEDPSLLSDARQDHLAISCHTAVDNDEDWSDIEVSLPVVIRPSAQSTTNAAGPEILSNFTTLLHVALNERRVSTTQIELATEQNDADNPEFQATLQRNLATVLGDLGVIVDDADVSGDVFLSTDNEDTDESELLVEDALTFLSDLNASSSDPLFQYQRDIGSRKTLSREREVALAISIEQGLKSAIGAAAQCPAAISEILRTISRVERGEATVGTLLSDYHPMRGLASPRVETADGELQEDLPIEPVDQGDGIARAIPNEIRARLDRISDCCTRLAANAIQQPTTVIASMCDELYSAGLSPTFLGHLQAVVSDADAASSGRIGDGLTKAREAKRELVEANLRLVFWQARKHRGLPLLDLVQEGNIALLKAVDRFDHRRGFRFATYGLWWIRQSIHRAIADKGRTVRIPVHILDKMRKLHKAVDAGASLTGHPPSLSEMANTLEIPQSAIWKMLQIADEPEDIYARTECGLSVADSIQDQRTMSPEDNAIQAALQIEIAKALTTLTPKEARVIRMRFGLGMDDEYTLEDVGKEYGVTRERIRQIESKALDKLAHPARSARLRSFLERTAADQRGEP